MKIINCVVKEVLSEPSKKEIIGDNYKLEWYDLDVLYSIKGKDEKIKTTLPFKYVTEAKLIGSGYEFFNAV